MTRWALHLDAESRANLALRARAHGVTRPAYVRALINGRRPGAEPGSEAALADRWWDSRSPSRRVSIWRNHAAAGTNDLAEESGQLSIDDALGCDGGNR